MSSFVPTPNLSHIKSKDYDKVYEPSEDTFLLMDALEADRDFISSKGPFVCMEVGSGSGCVSAFISNIVANPSCLLQFCTDRNHFAASITEQTGGMNQVALNSICTDFTGGLTERLRGNVDLLIFNPPYVVTPSEEIHDSQDVLRWSWAGGKDGREVLDRFIFDQSLPDILLSEKGLFYLVLIESNRPGEIMEIFERKWNITGEIIAKRKVGIEHLSILRFQRK